MTKSAENGGDRAESRLGAALTVTRLDRDFLTGYPMIVQQLSGFAIGVPGPRGYSSSCPPAIA